MLKKFATVIVAVFLLANIYGCVALLAGAAGGGGTAFWLGGKLSQELNASSDRTFKATKSALKAMRLEITKETIKEDVIQVMGNYTDGRTIWIDIRPHTETSSQIELRVGAKGDKEAAKKILNKIKRYL